jgi:hypothetical protein
MCYLEKPCITTYFLSWWVSSLQTSGQSPEYIQSLQRQQSLSHMDVLPSIDELILFSREAAPSLTQEQLQATLKQLDKLNFLNPTRHGGYSFSNSVNGQHLPMPSHISSLLFT